uniref:interleukin-10 isoform X3 n=1 Tax=Myodes glareolus TaxID=447135 RepID=UPI002020E48F|nr:interleukin-10 isoform X3 [Myodes glareolus]
MLPLLSLQIWGSTRHGELALQEDSSSREGRATQLRDSLSQKKDQLDNILLTDALLQDFKGYLGCQTLSEMIQFYLVEVMPQAENHGPEIKEHLNSLGEKLKTLRRQLQRCHRFLPCENKSKAVEQVKNDFNKLQEKGVYKAMNEFDIFINCIEEYMTIKMKS